MILQPDMKPEDYKVGKPAGEFAHGTLECPLNRALNMLAHKWTALIIYHLQSAGGAIRFRQLQRLIKPVTQKELTKKLREMEQAGLISRKIYPEVPPRVEYRLTDIGNSLVPILSALAEWAEVNCSLTETTSELSRAS